MRFLIKFSGRAVGAIGIDHRCQATVAADTIASAILSLYDRWEHVHPDYIETSIAPGIEGYAFSLTLIVWIGESYLDDLNEWVCTLYAPLGDKRFPDGRVLIGRRNLGETDMERAFTLAMAEAEQAIRVDRGFLSQGDAPATHSRPSGDR